MPTTRSFYRNKRPSASAVNNAKKFYSPLEKVAENTTPVRCAETIPLAFTVENLQRYYQPEFGDV